MLSFRMFFEDDEYIAALNLYSHLPDAFDEQSCLTGLALSTFGAIAVTSARRQERAVNLERALESNRDIGVAIGVLMALHKVTREQAFDLLRMASQAKHRKVRDLARDVAETGTLDFS
jgi:AmiR/NasT family two-component response regulator